MPPNDGGDPSAPQDGGIAPADPVAGGGRGGCGAATAAPQDSPGRAAGGAEPGPSPRPEATAEEPAGDVAIWGGVECSHVLIRGIERDQCAETGHDDRPGDLDLIAGLGLAKLRYPMLWAKIERPDGSCDFSGVQARFDRLRELGQTPIAGFLHHGSGPGGITPDDPDYVPRLASFAGEVAARFGWITDFTPVNEPVTTARFSFLYGHWHPHLCDEAAFLRAVAGSARATAAAMAAIRRRIPDARLVQTEDVGRIFSTPRLAHQAEYENLRRFLGFDLLTGRVDRTHPFWPRLIAAGVEAAALDALADAPCPPDVIGIDHYLTSDRFLDEDASRHPGAIPGGNGRESYVDVAAVHIPELAHDLGMLPRLRELHARYGLPLAITEAHNGCTREEQLRWLIEAWEAARAARAEGAAVIALTSWALLGSRDWNSLMARSDGFYESGAFDLRADPPRLTAVGRAVSALAREGRYSHALVELAGWWRHGTAGVAAMPHLTIIAGPAETEMLLACCRIRRIPVAVGVQRAAAVLGEIRVEGGRGGAPWRFRYARVSGPGRPEGERLEVEAPPGGDFTCAANAFLDLVIDGETGSLRLAALGADNQYVAQREEAPAPRRRGAGS